MLSISNDNQRMQKMTAMRNHLVYVQSFYASNFHFIRFQPNDSGHLLKRTERDDDLIWKKWCAADVLFRFDFQLCYPFVNSAILCEIDPRLLVVWSKKAPGHGSTETVEQLIVHQNSCAQQNRDRNRMRHYYPTLECQALCDGYLHSRSGFLWFSTLTRSLDPTVNLVCFYLGVAC